MLRLKRSLEDRFDLEWAAYKKEECISVSDDVFEWWKTHQKLFPVLAQMAKTYLAIFASSADVERLFSVAGRVVSPLRTSLSSSKVEKLIFLHRNIDRFSTQDIAEVIANKEDS